MNKNLVILVTGVRGQLGFDVLRELNERGYKNVIGIDREELDITDEDKVKQYIEKLKPDIVIHNAAWTAVDKAEEMYDEVYKVNALGPKYIAEACRKIDAKMIYISTDYVFDGRGDRFFEVTDCKNGLSVYGKTKSIGEDFVTSILKKYFIVRISWVFGQNGHNFIKTMLKLAETKTELSVVDDQIGSPTYTYDLSKLLCDMMETGKYGIYHATNEGICSWYEFAKFIFEIANVKNIKVNPIHTSEYLKMVTQQAKRPLNSRLSKESLTKAGFEKLPTWQDATTRFIKNYLKQKEK